MRGDAPRTTLPLTPQRMPQRLWCQEKRATASFPRPCLILSMPVLYNYLNHMEVTYFLFHPFSILSWSSLREASNNDNHFIIARLLQEPHFDQREPHRVERRLGQRVECFGYEVSLQPRALAS
jgi:hypothetical protein